jgi:carboxyl-terminal processing protease
MKTEIIWNALPDGVRTLVLPSIVSMVLLVTPVLRAASADWLLEKGIYTEETKGQLRAAIALYQQIVDDPKAERAMVAQAQLRLGLCELKLGNKPRAISALERLTAEFPDKDKLLALVEKHMPRLLDEMLVQIEQNYIQEIDRSELMETALHAMIGKLDGRGQLRPDDMEFLSTNQLAEMNVQIDQKVAGIGVVLQAENGRVIVGQEPLAGSPAMKGGLKLGDRIVSIDGNELPRNNLAMVVKLLRGPVGTPVAVGVKRGNADELLEFNLVRNTIRLETLRGDHRKPDGVWEFLLPSQMIPEASRDKEKKIGYMHLSQVGKQSADEVQEAMTALKAQGMEALILDLRNNPGGMLDGAVTISDMFVETGRILTVKGRMGETVYDAKPAGTFLGFPMAVLVNSNTASAGEIIAACLQDNERAVVIGERTFGQGIVRSIVKLTNGLGALKLPVASYYRPSGKNVNRYPGAKDSDDWGVTPNEGYATSSSKEAMAKAVEYLHGQLQKK